MPQTDATPVSPVSQPKPCDQIAARFAISSESAKYFLGRIQKSFKKNKPTQALILEFLMKQRYKTLPEAYDVAKKMVDKNVWVYPLNAPPPPPQQDEPDVYK